MLHKDRQRKHPAVERFADEEVVSHLLEDPSSSHIGVSLVPLVIRVDDKDSLAHVFQHSLVV